MQCFGRACSWEQRQLEERDVGLGRGRIYCSAGVTGDSAIPTESSRAGIALQSLSCLNTSVTTGCLQGHVIWG